MTKFIHKRGRKRPFIGRLKSYNDLDVNVQETFRAIKKEINIRLGRDIDVYVFGSYFWGYADANSDYDVRIEGIEDEKLKNLREIGKRITKALDKDVHIMCIDEDRVYNEGILIP